MPHAVTVSTTRSMTWWSEVSRSSVPGVPRKYFWARMLVAFRHQVVGHLDAELLEGDGAVPVVGDPGVAPLPDDLVVRVDTVGGEVATDADGGPLGGNCHVMHLPLSASAKPCRTRRLPIVTRRQSTVR